jgi:hypothetical protein
MAVSLESLDPRNLPFEVKNIPADKVRVSRDIQTRVRLDAHKVDEYAELLRRKVEFKDNIEVYYDGFFYWIADGHHRFAAYEKVGRLRIPAIVREGGQQLAFVHALGANAEHGLPRKREDIQRSIRMALENKETGRLSARKIAKLVRCSPGMVDNMIKTLGKGRDSVVVTDKHGNEIEMDVSGQKERAKNSYAFGSPANTFHELPVNVKDAFKAQLRAMADMTRENLAFSLTWWEQHKPATPRKAKDLLTELELEEQARQEAEDDDDRLGPADEPADEDR